jgi:hypothetical protein
MIYSYHTISPKGIIYSGIDGWNIRSGIAFGSLQYNSASGMYGNYYSTSVAEIYASKANTLIGATAQYWHNDGFVSYYGSNFLYFKAVRGDGASGQGGNQISMNENHNRIGFVPLDVGENYGAYQMANYRCNISVRGNQKQITIRATSSNTPVAEAEVKFNAKAWLLVNGNITLTKSLANGLAIFELPSSQNTSLIVRGGWNVYYDAGGAAVPVFHPIFFPFTLNFEDNFKLK